MTKKVIKDPERKPNWTLFKEYPNKNVDLLYDVYKLDHKKARVLFCQRKTEYKGYRHVLFEWPDDEFRICYIRKTHGISKTNRIYSREMNISSIRYTKGRLYYQEGVHIRQATWSNIHSFLGGMGSREDWEIDENPCYKYLISKFGWFRNIRENHDAHCIALNTIKTHKLFSKKALQRFQFKTSIPSIRVIEANLGTFSYDSFLKMWSEMRHQLINVENITGELMSSPYFKDSSLMAEALGEKINCAWSPKRLKLEHDKWAKRVTDVILEFEPLRDLKIAEVFKEFQEFSGYDMLLTNHQLIEEGKRMGHCVGTYSSKVDGGTSAIYRVHEHTLELVVNTPYYGKDKDIAHELGLKSLICIGQYHGFSNISAPTIYRGMVEEMIFNFNKLHMYKFDGKAKVQEEDLLPF